MGFENMREEMKPKPYSIISHSADPHFANLQKIVFSSKNKGWKQSTV